MKESEKLKEKKVKRKYEKPDIKVKVAFESKAWNGYGDVPGGLQESS